MRRRELIAGLVALAVVVAPAVAASQTTPPELAAKLTPAQRQIYEDYRRARDAFEAKLRTYWARVDAKRDARRAKHMLAQPLSSEDYVAEQPPKYAGPELPAEIAKLVVEVLPPTPSRPLPELSDFLANAKAEYGFVPAPTTELDFKRRYAREALAVGLSKDQVVRIYALETGGQGTYDMQSGINPVTKQGRPISTALGYAQLLNGNSVSELVKHGTRFAQRLISMAAQPGTPPARAAGLRDKATIVRRMLRAARSVPNEWAAHVRFGGTPSGLGIHALNLDADVGPWLQVLKLKGLKEAAEAAGRSQLSGAEIELMNLAGPRTGLEMMTPLGRTMPTSNFFSEGGYYRNTIVREKSAAELLAALEQRMELSLKKAGAVEFAQVFDEVAGR
ncbi:MAG TPA: hypothetical protein VN523_05015 [Hyphomicrobiaceae bacterium]|nr:hypothetical protein [Hyphomicrobiaceae bacterium]